MFLKNARHLTVHITVVMVVLSVTTLTVVTLVEAYVAVRAQQRAIASEQLSVAHAAAMSVSSFIQDQMGDLEHAAFATRFSELSSAEQRDTLDRILHHQAAFYAIAYVDVTGAIKDRVSRRMIGEHAYTDITVETLPEEGYVSPMWFDDVTGEPFVTLAVPVRNVFGDVVGALVAESNVTFMWDLVATVTHETPNSSAYVVDRTGRLVAFEETERVLAHENVSRITEVREFMENITSGVHEHEVHGEHVSHLSKGIRDTWVMATQEPLGVPDWAVVVEVPWRDAYASVIGLLMVTSGLIVLALLATVVASYYLARRITLPIIRLRDTALAIREGKIDTLLSVKSHDEIGDLAAAFEDMTATLREERANLEGRVREKTAALTAQMAETEVAKRAMLNLLEDLEVEKEKTEALVVERTKELSNEKARLLASINALSFGFVVADANDMILLQNPAMTRILDLNITPVTIHDITREFGAYVGSSLGFDPVSSCRRCMELRTPVEVKEVAYVQKILRVMCAPIFAEITADMDEDQVPVIGYVFMVEDVTEAKVLERSRDEFFAIASHELRTPLTAIRGNSDMILDLYSEKIPDTDMREMLSDINSASTRLIDIVNDFLEVSRIEQGKIEFKLEDFDLGEILAKVLRDLKDMVAKKGVELVYNPPAEALPTVRGDKARVEQVLVNLVGNAIKFTKEGTITIAVERSGSFLKVRVQDTGIGISDQNEALLFRKFQQAGEQMLARDVTQGTGLGLYISKMLIERMGGTIGLEWTEFGKGSSFAFTVPIVI